MKKIRPDDKLGNLPEEAQEKLSAWFKTPGFTLEKIRILTSKELQVEVAVSQLSRWWKKRSDQESIDRTFKACTAANAIKDQAEQQLPLLNKALIASLTQSVFELSHSGADDKRMHNLMDIVIKMQAQSITKDQLALEMEKFKYTIKTDIERGMDALFAEIKNNPNAITAYENLKKIVKAA